MRAGRGPDAADGSEGIAIPLPGFFLDPASDDWVGGHSFRQRQRRPQEAVVVPASPTKRVHYEVSYDHPKNAISTARYNVVTFLPAQLAAQFSKVANVYFLFSVILEQVPGWSPTGRWATLLPLSVFVTLSIVHEGYDDLRRHHMDRAENRQLTRVLKVKVHDRTAAFSLRGLCHRGSQSIHTLGHRPSADAAHAGCWWSAVSAVRSRVTARVAEARRGSRECEHSGDEDEDGASAAGTALRQRIERSAATIRTWSTRRASSTIVPPERAADAAPGALPDTMGCRWKRKRWENVQVGDLVMICKDEWVPADCVVLASADPAGACFVETAALDGETALKQKQALPATHGRIQTAEQLAAFCALTHVEAPSAELYSFKGFMEIGGERHPLTPSQLLLRGSVLRNTAHVFAQVVYAGEHTRLRLNATRNVRTKAPQIQRITNQIVVLVFVLLVVLCALFSWLGVRWGRRQHPRHWYLGADAMSASVLFFGYVLMMNTLIPISLYVTLEMVKIAQCWFIQQDAAMYHAESGSRAEARTTAINEDLGMVRYVFSDKTGTLTENVMRLRAVMCAGFSYQHADPSAHDAASKRPEDNTGDEEEEEEEEECDPDLIGPGEPGDPRAHTRASDDAPVSDLLRLPPTGQMLGGTAAPPSEVFRARAEWFLRCLALCHTVQPDRDPATGRIAGYQAVSPDEKALVAAAAELGYAMDGRAGALVRLRVAEGAAKDGGGRPAGRVDGYEVLDVLEFSSARRRMSVIMRCPDGRIVLVAKGADSAIWPRLRAPQDLRSDPLDRAFMPSPVPLAPAALHVRRASFTASSSSSSSSSSRAATPSPSCLSLPSAQTRGRRQRQPLPPTSPQISPASDVSGSTAAPDSAEAQASFAEPTAEEEQWVRARALEALHQFSTEGLRTLVYAHKEIAPAAYEAWRARYAQATAALAGRQQQIEAACEEMERGLLLAGVSAIEDRLQAGVPETIFKLRRAGIRVWMLTGDKVETAVNIARSCRLIDTDAVETAALDRHVLDCAAGRMLLLTLQSAADPAALDRTLDAALAAARRLEPVAERFEARSHRERLRRGLKTFGAMVGVQPGAGSAPRDGDKRQGGLSVAVDGETLSLLEESAGLLDKFLALGTLCDAVVCSRVSPAQKALVVHRMRVRCEGGDRAARGWRQWVRRALGRDGDRYMVTLAIGDGGNDIAMIQEAHVGIGIAGQEGLQASRAADFSIGQFRFLQRLLLVHGRWSYVRVSLFVMSTFYKCMALFPAQLMYQFYTGFCGTSLFEGTTLSFYNTLFTFLPPMAVGIFDQDLQPATLLDFPELYRDMGPRCRLLSVPQFIRRVWAVGTAHAALGILLPLVAALPLGYGGTTSDQFTLGVCVFGTVVATVVVKTAYLDMRRWTLPAHLSVVLMLALWIGYNGLLSHVYSMGVGNGFFGRGVFVRLMAGAAFWMQWVVSVAAGLCLCLVVNLICTVRDPAERRLASWFARERAAEHAANGARRREWLSRRLPNAP
ncbi:hypothetical protein H4R18_004702 [Coemansia javaensis]|uniref:Phospholipid-transporting ATPase n=1 Tax=Coemansia javaensis TaxID=2761396 RepID=A0A9W8LEG0_9FUNG|nr:hypothetical protein H4R18_004702 [Coemansia javaensis]